MSYLNSDKDIFQIGLTLFKCIGENLYQTSLKIYLFRAINFAILLFIAVFICANFFYASGGMYVNTLEDLITVFHTLFKYSLFIYYKSDIGDILTKRIKYYWSYEDLDKTLVDNLDNLYAKGRLVQVIMLNSMIFTIQIILLKPLYDHSSVYLLDSTIFVDSTVLETILLACHYYFFCIIAAIVFGYDSIYISLCLDLVIQVRMLKYKMRRTFTKMSNEMLKDIGKCVDQHLYLLSVYGKMREMYSTMLLFHYFVSFMTACLDMYLSFIGEETMVDQIIKFVSIAVIITQFAFYALPAELVWAEFSDISQSVYMSKWYQTQPEVQRTILLIIGKSQRTEYFSAAGLLDINLDAFGSVVRKTFSFYALIRNILDK